MSHIPYGYRIHNGEVVKDENEASKIKALFNHYLVSKSMRASAKEVGIDKVHSAIGRILRNKTYLGNEFYPQIIESELFEKVQELREQNAFNQNRTKVTDAENKATIIPNYQVEKIKQQFDNPYQQAEYVYYQIKEV
ncbi:hypothetical protein I4Q36_05185 [Tuanshanicoccus lijuaniae]|uniref:recombinase family protein n=1 Tax=Aerococcaceae bacterium zg-1292 TaxID=2774330 RepID=UPI0019390304|nr:hypothetical protein [Aerococcaceae bacterium zg-1292]QQA38066.1 hypothetical protein I4Q36_05185 [Aerococcaceae bacterium zg-1292]